MLNYVETTYGPQRFATKMVASGALERHPNMKVLISEGGASWIPFIGDRILEGYRQHGLFVKPKLKENPKEVLFRQVYTTFQHDVTAVDAAVSGYKNILWGSDYPHLEGTFGHTQETLHDIFDRADPQAAPAHHDRFVPRTVPACLHASVSGLRRGLITGLQKLVMPTPTTWGCGRSWLRS